MTDPKNMSEEETLMREIAKSAATVYAGMDIDTPIEYTFHVNEIPVLRASERIRVVYIREHIPPKPLQPTPLYIVESLPEPALG